MSMQKRRYVSGIGCILAFFLASLVFLFPQSERTLAAGSALKKKLTVGGLFSITGSWSTLGQSSAAALRLAAEDLNAYFDRIGARFEVAIATEDTQLDPQVALRKLQSLAARGVRVVVGPQSSAEVAAVKAFADANDILLISQSSTAGSLSIAGDNIYRFCPDDDLEGAAIAALMYADGIRVIVPIWRNDAGNAGLHDATKRHFEALSGTMATGIVYAADVTDFSDAVSGLEALVGAEVAQHGAGAVAVYAAAFDEIADVFKLADDSPVLSATPWYGSDGIALSTVLLNDSEAAAFANRANYPNPTFGFDSYAAVKSAPIMERIREITGFDPDAFALGVYDAAWVAARTAALDKNRIDFDFFKHEFPEVAGSFFGTTGWTVLNGAGDRRFGNFDFWAIRYVDGVQQWKVVASYNTASKVLIRYD